MKYLCLIYLEEGVMDALTEADREALLDECVAYDDRLRRRGARLASEALQPPHTATTVRVRNGSISVTDGPFAETRERLGGFYLVEAADLNQAIRLAAGIPPARLGSVEIRPVRDAPHHRARGGATGADPRTRAER